MGLKTQEALKLALEAICGSGDFLFNWHDCEPNNEREMQRYQATLADNEKAFKAIKEALAEQPAQQQDHDCALKRGGIVCRHCDLEIVEASDAPQIARQQDIPDLIAGALGVSRGTAYDMMREVLAGAQQQPTVEDNSQNWLGMDGTTAYWLIQRHADGWPDAGKMMTEWLEANQTQPAQQQEPVAWADLNALTEQFNSVNCGTAYRLPGENRQPLYTSPQPSKPLTDEQIMEMYNESRSDAEMLEFARAIEVAHGIKGDA